MKCDVDRMELPVDRPNRSFPRLIQNEATTEIPLHRLFRDEPGPGRPDHDPSPAALGPPVAGSGQRVAGSG